VARRCGALAVAILAASAGAARAQVAWNLAASSDYRYRGASWSDGRAAASLAVSYDHPSGLYAGARLVAGAPRHYGPKLVGAMEYAGFVARPAPRLAIDLGVINYQVTTYRYPYGGRRADYQEVYVGLVGDNFNANLYYAPDYYRSGVRTLYADLGGGLPVTADLRVFGHVGMLAPVGGRRGPQARKTRYDLKAGAALALRDAELSVAWTRLTPAYLPRAEGGERAGKVTVGISFFF
jgi:uncharacterized protein (TIGR02001 family)